MHMNISLTMITRMGLLGALCASQHLAAESEGPKITTAATGIKMALIPGGTFKMGDPGGKDDEKPVHKVTLGSFYMDVCEVTQELFEAHGRRS